MSNQEVPQQTPTQPLNEQPHDTHDPHDPVLQLPIVESGTEQGPPPDSTDQFEKVTLSRSERRNQEHDAELRRQWRNITATKEPEEAPFVAPRAGRFNAFSTNMGRAAVGLLLAATATVGLGGGFNLTGPETQGDQKSHQDGYTVPPDGAYAPGTPSITTEMPNLAPVFIPPTSAEITSIQAEAEAETETAPSDEPLLTSTTDTLPAPVTSSVEQAPIEQTPIVQTPLTPVQQPEATTDLPKPQELTNPEPSHPDPFSETQPTPPTEQVIRDDPIVGVETSNPDLTDTVTTG